MGRSFAQVMQQSPVWEVAAICDVKESARAEARRLFPQAQVTADPEEIFDNPQVPVVGLFTLADVRPALIMSALSHKKHILSEKPIAADSATEWKLVEAIEAGEKAGLLVAVNLFNRNAWYHKEIQQCIAAGEIGELAIVRVCHMTPGHMPSEGHEPEGPPFHDCGMHYVDVVRWYGKSEFKMWHAQGLRMWNHPEPWWVQCHGTLENGVVFDITQGFVYGHLARDKTHNCYVDCIGTRGVARMRHDFKDATIEVHGTERTFTKTAHFNDKKLDVMVDLFARSLIAGKNLGLPAARDSAIASEVAWKMLQDAVSHDPPSIGTPGEMQEILAYRRSLQSGFGLPLRADGETGGPETRGHACA